MSRKRFKKNVHPNSIKNLQPFTGGPDKRRYVLGSPKRNLAQLEEIVGVQFKVSLSKNDKYQIIESLLETPLAELQEIVKNDSTPVFIINVASAIISDTKKGLTHTLDSLLDRFFGKAKQESVIIGDKEQPVVINQESTLIYMPSNGRDQIQPGH